MHRRISAVGAAVVALTASALMAGCSSSGGSPFVPSTSGASAGSDTAKGVDPDTSSPTSSPVTAASGEYSPLTPLESDHVSHFVVPTYSSDAKEVIGMYVYTLPAARTVTARTDQVNLIKAYNARAKARVSGTIHRATSPVDGLPAYSETATEPGNFTYIAYWAFGTHHFFQYSCQLGSTGAVAGLAIACGTTLASLQLR